LEEGRKKEYLPVLWKLALSSKFWNVSYIYVSLFSIYFPLMRSIVRQFILRCLWQLHNDHVMILRLVLSPRSVRHSPVFGKLWATCLCCLSRGDRFRWLLYKIQNGFSWVKRLGHEDDHSYPSAEVNYASSRALTHPHALMAFTATRLPLCYTQNNLYFLWRESNPARPQ
jgi:hypothetical protein